MTAKGISFSGNFDQHPPDPEFLSKITEANHFWVNACLVPLATKVTYDDKDNVYTTNFAWQNIIFLELVFFAEKRMVSYYFLSTCEEICNVPLTNNDLVARAIPYALGAAMKKEVERIQELFNDRVQNPREAGYKEEMNIGFKQGPCAHILAIPTGASKLRGEAGNFWEKLVRPKYIGGAIPG